MAFQILAEIFFILITYHCPIINYIFRWECQNQVTKILTLQEISVQKRWIIFQLKLHFLPIEIVSITDRNEWECWWCWWLNKSRNWVWKWNYPAWRQVRGGKNYPADNYCQSLEVLEFNFDTTSWLNHFQEVLVLPAVIFVHIPYRSLHGLGS